MKTILMLLMILPAITFAEEEESTLFRALGYGVWATQITDLASTQYALDRGGTELNPLWVNNDVRNTVGVAAKLGLAYAVNRSTSSLYKGGKKKTAMIMRIALVSAFGYATTKNLYVGMTIGR